MTINEMLAQQFAKLGLIEAVNAKEFATAADGLGKPLFEYLVANGDVEETVAYKAAAKIFDLPFAETNIYVLDDNLIFKISSYFMVGLRAIPYTIDDQNRLLVMVDNPFHLTQVRAMGALYDLPVVVKLTTKSGMNALIDSAQAMTIRIRATNDLMRQQGGVKGKTVVRAKGAEQDYLSTPAVQLASTILKEAVEQHASDIHIEPMEDKCRVRFRVDGVLMDHVNVSMELYPALLARYKIMANLDISEHRKPQDGKISTVISGKTMDFRVSTLPVVYGEKVVIRAYNAKANSMTVDALTDDPRQREQMKRMLKSPYGIILLTGPTGSGKTTTLYSFLNDLNTEGVNITTIEDPVENNISGINQTQVNERAGITFASALRSILRQDPNVIMVGEIRDEETAHIAVQAAITGHLVLSTLHTNDSVTTITRLVDMGIKPYLVADALVGAISKRLVRRLCPYCKVKHFITTAEADATGLKLGAEVSAPKGCERCNHTGYLGRIGIYEIMEVDDAIKAAIVDPDFSSEKIRKVCVKEGLVPLADACAKMVLEGKTSVEEMNLLLTAEEAAKNDPLNKAIVK